MTPSDEARTLCARYRDLVAMLAVLAGESGDFTYRIDDDEVAADLDRARAAGLIECEADHDAPDHLVAGHAVVTQIGLEAIAHHTAFVAGVLGLTPRREEIA
jgi:hypothetical protein